MKNMHDCNKTNDECNKRMELMENQINLLREICNFKNKFITSLLENLFNHENHQIKSHNGNTTLTPTNLMVITNSRNDKFVKESFTVDPILN